MHTPNEFLLCRHQAVGIGNCFCDGCKVVRLQQLDDVGIDELYAKFVNMSPRTETERLNLYHTEVLSQIVYGEKYKQVAMADTTFKYFGVWAKHQFPY